MDQGLEGELDCNAEILPARAQKVESQEGAAIRKISKGEQRKLKQIAREKAMKAQREQVTYGKLPYELQFWGCASNFMRQIYGKWHTKAAEPSLFICFAESASSSSGKRDP